jgi:hypothetical protein
MSVKLLLDRLVPRCSSGWNRSTGLRPLIKEIERGQDMLINTLGERRIWCGTDNKGWPPYLLTTSGTYTYEIKASNLSSGSITLSLAGSSYTVTADIVRRVFIDVSQGGYDSTVTWLAEPALYSDLNPYSNEIERLWVSEVAISSFPAVGSANPTVTFPFNPGTTTTKFFVEFYWRAPRLTSESIPLVVPEEFERALEDFVIAYVQECENGAPSQLMERFEGYWKTQFKNKFAPAARTRTNRVISRPF